MDDDAGAGTSSSKEKASPEVDLSKHDNEDSVGDSYSDVGPSDSASSEGNILHTAVATVHQKSNSRKLKIRGRLRRKPSRKKFTRYDHELASVIKGIKPNVDHAINIPLRDSLVNQTQWTSTEKEQFFTALSTKGLNEVRAIAFSIESKSLSEVHEYLELLRQGLHELNLHGRRRLLSMAHQIPAAIELSGDCVRALNRAADVISLKHEEQLVSREEALFGGLNVLDYGVAEAYDRSDTEEGNEGMGASSLNPMVVFRLKNFIELSTRVFMNSSIKEENWESYVPEGGSPSIMYSAFSEFLNLTVSALKRLMQSAMFFAMSRLRATDRSRSIHLRKVRRRDVIAAVKTLNLQPDSQVFWTHAACRSNVEVYEKVKYGRGVGQRLDQQTIERRLQGMVRGDVDTKSSSVIKSKQFQTSRSQNPGSDSESDLAFADPDLVDIDSSNDGETLDESAQDLQEEATQAGDLSSDADTAADQVDDYTEAIDRHDSRTEEGALWALLTRGHSEMKNIPKGAEIPKRPKAVPKDKDDQSSWRDWVEYHRSWEEYGILPSEKKFERNRRRRVRETSPFVTNKRRRNSRQEHLQETQKVEETITGRDTDGFETTESSSGNEAAHEDRMTNDTNINPSDPLEADMRNIRDRSSSHEVEESSQYLSFPDDESPQGPVMESPMGSK
ncbi:hypothetical protein MMC09_006025 [Bachmanniomyces sp. S44760]|nr:hypothetical protein [Bachmanniomyces sp. S44760]